MPGAVRAVRFGCLRHSLLNRQPICVRSATGGRRNAHALDAQARNLLAGSFTMVDINAVSEYNAVMATITIRKLEERVKRKLRVRGAQHGRSMEAEARAILTHGVLEGADGRRTDGAGATGGHFDRLVGKWKGRTTTDELMALTRGRS